MEERNCFNCRFLIRFTPPEREEFRARLTREDLAGSVFGACSNRGWTRPPLIVSRYLDHPLRSCPHWESGFFRDRVGSTCPQCKEGETVVVRPARDKRTYTLIGCSRYPECRFTTWHFPLETECRFCGIPLVIGSGDRLVCYCPQCTRSCAVPLTMASWPQLLRSKERCPHGLEWSECKACAHSIDEKRCLIDLEFPVAAALERELRAVRSQQFADSRHWESSGDDYWDEDWWPSDSDASWDDSLDEMIDYTTQYMVRWARSTEEGWFYEDY